MSDQPELVKSEKLWEFPIKVTEITALVVAYALVGGLIYDASFFGLFDSGLFYLMSVHDHLNSAIVRLPSAMAAVR